MNALANRILPDTETGARTGTLEAAAARYGLGRNSLREVAKQAGAVVKIGRRVIINYAILDSYLDSISGC